MTDDCMSKLLIIFAMVQPMILGVALFIFMLLRRWSKQDEKKKLINIKHRLKKEVEALKNI